MKSEKHRNRRSFSGLFCFGGPRVNDSDVQPPASGGREKKKVLTHSPARSRPVRDGEESRPKKSSAEDRDDNNNGNKNGDKNEHLNLFQTQIKDDISIIQALPTQNSLPIQKRPHNNEPKPHKIVSLPGKLDPSIGVGIMTITLAMVTFLGRGIAIIWLCSCFCVLQLARATAPCDGGEKNSSKMIDMDSAEYKKRIVLEGFLERNGRKPSNVA
ncbi:uncharacterized protein At5g23160-like [Zingiber officinale]|uniref:uncharacterized protein At5g23160-like n=1 Tax=Zingiber officinale TaxID=94328 RepID=UPI001C4D2384|nr:uncharacterized protein At5g23160-like [Zingiber officinale]